MSSSAITGPVLSDVRRAPSGTAAAPSFAFNDSTGTGVYLVSAGVLGLSTAGVQRVVVDASGNVGIGTASPFTFGTYKSLDIRGAGGGWLNMGTTGTSSFYIFTDGTNSGVVTQTNGYLGFSTNNTERMRIDASGRLVVNPLLTHNATAGIVTANGYGGRAGLAGSSSNVFNIHWTGSVPQLWIDSSNMGTISTSSDYRIKKNIETQELPALERIAQLRSVKYEFADYKELFKADGVQREGFIAHELQAVIPSAVDGEKDAEDQIQSLKLDALCSVMVKAIQELSTKVDAQAAEIEALKAK